MEANAAKSAQAEQRAAKKTARRAAFIQDVAEAVYSLGVQRQHEIEAKQQAVKFAASEQERLYVKLAEAELTARSPIEATYCLNHNVERAHQWVATKFSFEDYRAKEALAWAIKVGMLPEGTTQLPSTEGQFLAYATWKGSHPELIRQ